MIPLSESILAFLRYYILL